ncbi:hypothetical protein AAZX31_08G180600 [Glycine max]
MHASQLMMGLNFEEPWKKGETKKRSKRAERVFGSHSKLAVDYLDTLQIFNT